VITKYDYQITALAAWPPPAHGQRHAQPYGCVYLAGRC
jgi:hypothetical protein